MSQTIYYAVSVFVGLKMSFGSADIRVSFGICCEPSEPLLEQRNVCAGLVCASKPNLPLCQKPIGYEYGICAERTVKRKINTLANKPITHDRLTQHSRDPAVRSHDREVLLGSKHGLSSTELAKSVFMYFPRCDRVLRKRRFFQERRKAQIPDGYKEFFTLHPSSDRKRSH